MLFADGSNFGCGYPGSAVQIHVMKTCLGPIQIAGESSLSRSRLIEPCGRTRPFGAGRAQFHLPQVSCAAGLICRPFVSGLCLAAVSHGAFKLSLRRLQERVCWKFASADRSEPNLVTEMTCWRWALSGGRHSRRVLLRFASFGVIPARFRVLGK